MKLILIPLILLFSLTVNAAQWTPSAGSVVGVINPGAVSGKSTYITLDGISFAGCANSSGAILLGDNPNYSEIYSLLLAAKMANKLVRVYYGNCSGSFAIINQVYVL